MQGTQDIHSPTETLTRIRSNLQVQIEYTLYDDTRKSGNKLNHL